MACPARSLTLGQARGFRPVLRAQGWSCKRARFAAKTQLHGSCELKGRSTSALTDFKVRHGSAVLKYSASARGPSGPSRSPESVLHGTRRNADLSPKARFSLSARLHAPKWKHRGLEDLFLFHGFSRFTGRFTFFTGTDVPRKPWVWPNVRQKRLSTAKVERSARCNFRQRGSLIERLPALSAPCLGACGAWFQSNFTRRMSRQVWPQQRPPTWFIVCIGRFKGDT